ncbi:MAG: signal peptidase II [Solirubrobacteraceae bacterium]
MLGAGSQIRAGARPQAVLRAAFLAALIIALDQITKHTLGTWIRPRQVRHVVPGLTLVHVRNSGVAFNFLAGDGAAVYAPIGVALLALITYLLARPERRLIWLPAGMLVGGALGNLIDRVARGSVIDFIQLPHWPAFNVADISITFGVIVLAVVIERAGPRDRPRGADEH